MKRISRGQRMAAAVLGTALAATSMLGIVHVHAAQAAAPEHLVAGRTATPDGGHTPWIASYPPNL